MVETIAPVVYGGRARWLAALVLHAFGAVLTAAAFGVVLGWIGAALSAPWGRAGAAVLAGVALVYAVGELPRAQVRVPQLRRQVPDWWRTFFAWPIAAFLYGAGLGIGFFTYLAHGTLLAVSVGAMATGRPVLGALVMAPFGLARGLSPLRAIRVETPEDGRRLVDALAGSSEDRRAIANGLVLLAVAALALADAARLRDGWSAIAAAMIALVFSRAAASKLVDRRRWGQALEARGFGARFSATARWAVPAAEAVVPALALLGYARASCAWALVLIVAFTAEVVRARVRVGPAIPCGCFGARRTTDMRTVMTRNVALAGLAVLGWVGAVEARTISWPGVPRSGSFLPMVLAVGGLLVAGCTAWRTTVWLERGRS